MQISRDQLQQLIQLSVQHPPAQNQKQLAGQAGARRRPALFLKKRGAVTQRERFFWGGKAMRIGNAGERVERAVAVYPNQKGMKSLLYIIAQLSQEYSVNAREQNEGPTSESCFFG